jgi:hypothetical protein
MENLTCIAWGDLRKDKVGRLQHFDCPVVVEIARAGLVYSSLGTAIPPLVVCPCGCRTCKDAWFAAGQPVVRDEKIIRCS